MLLSGYIKEISRPQCNPRFESIHCIAHLNEDVSEALPYLNAVLGGKQYLRDPPEVMFLHHGKLIKVGAREIAINALKDDAEAVKILEWLKNELNRAWADRQNITPRYEGQTKPKLLEVLRLLPKTNCKKCGQPTCMVFAAQVVDGGRGPAQCPQLPAQNREKLTAYLADFGFED